jgi:S-DNA-T family DNA segregation ATPase FtsK/SpoIIIE
MASRTSSPARPSRAAPKSTRRPAASTTRPRKAPARRRVTPGPVPRLLAAIGRLVRAIWVGAAHLVGAAARALGRGARDLDPAHRRDGLGLTLIAGAATLVAATWFGVDGWFVSWASMVMTALIGALAWLSPLILLGLASVPPPSSSASSGCGT